MTRPVLQWSHRNPLAIEAIGLIVGLAIWELIGELGVTSWLPPVHSVFAEVWTLVRDGQLKQPLIESVRNLLIGYAISVGAGVILGTMMAAFKYLDFALLVYVNALMATPSVLLVPVLYVIFGLSSFTLIAVIVLYATVFIVANTRSAVDGARKDLSEMSESFGAGPVRGFLTVTLRSAGPEIFVGLRLGMGRAVKGMFNGELLIAVVGLAQIDRNFAGAFNAKGILAVAMVVLVIAVVLATVLEAINRTLNGWALTKSGATARS